jgi:hypothetical protein
MAGWALDRFTIHTDRSARPVHCDAWLSRGHTAVRESDQPLSPKQNQASYDPKCCRDQETSFRLTACRRVYRSNIDQVSERIKPPQEH